MFIHDAVLESLSCGDTQILAGDLVVAIQRLREKDEHTQRTGFETQFQVRIATTHNRDELTWHWQVLGQVSPKDNEVVRSTAIKFPKKNRNTNFLPCKQLHLGGLP